jgi:hypothetical protein
MLEEELEIKNKDDWYRVSYEQIKSLVGGRQKQLKKVTLAQVLHQVYPQHKWDIERLKLAGSKQASQNTVKLLLQRLKISFFT